MRMHANPLRTVIFTVKVFDYYNAIPFAPIFIIPDYCRFAIPDVVVFLFSDKLQMAKRRDFSLDLQLRQEYLNVRKIQIYIKL